MGQRAGTEVSKCFVKCTALEKTAKDLLYKMKSQGTMITHGTTVKCSISCSGRNNFNQFCKLAVKQEKDEVSLTQ